MSKATVSRVLNESGYVGAKTRTQVENAIRELGYIPSAAARNLSRRVSDTIGLIIPEVHNPFFSNIVQGISTVVNQQNLILILSNTNNKAEEDLKTLYAMRQHRLRGLVYTPAEEYEGEQREEVKAVLGQFGAVVLLDRILPGIDVDSVSTDNYAGAYASAKALVDAGHRRIGIVAGQMSLRIARERMAGFQQALEDNGLQLRPEDIIRGEFEVSATYAHTRERLMRGDTPTAFFVSNNLSGMGFIRAVFEQGLSIPGDIAYIGFDMIENLELFGLDFSCLDRDVARMGREAMRLLLERAERPRKPYEQLVISPVLRLTGSEKRWPA